MQNCKVCNAQTDLLFEIDRVDYPICQKCASSIFMSQATAYYQNKTIFDIGNKKERKSKRLYRDIALEVLEYLYNELLQQDIKFEKQKLPKQFLQFISDRINEGYTSSQLKAVAYLKFKEWKGTNSEMYIRADTLYRPTNFARYMSEVEIKKPQWEMKTTKEQRAIIKQLNFLGLDGVCDSHTDKLAKKLIELGYNKKQFLNLYLIEKI